MNFIWISILALAVTQSTLAENPSVNLSQNLTLDQYLKLVLQQNFDLKIEDAKLEILDAKSVSLGLPPPMLSFNRMTEQDGSSSSGLEISQMIPFPTKLTANHSARKYAFQAQRQSKFLTQKQTLLNAKLLYLTLWQNQEKLSLLQEKKALLQNHLKLTRSSVRSDSFATVHLLKTESDLDMLDTEIESAKQMILERQFALATSINAETSFKITAVEPKISAVPVLSDLDKSHYFKAKELNLESLNAKVTEAKSSWLPDFTLKYKQMEKTAMDMAYNEIMIGVTLPFVFFWEPYSLSKQANQEALVGQYELNKEKRNINAEKFLLLSRIESLKKQLDILNLKLIPRAEKRMKLVHNIVPRDLETLQDHRETMEAYPELKLKAIDFRLEFEKSVADLEKYMSLKESENE